LRDDFFEKLDVITGGTRPRGLEAKNRFAFQPPVDAFYSVLAATC
jgi:hypothetical protein